jgi:hypothetical protein
MCLFLTHISCLQSVHVQPGRRIVTASMAEIGEYLSEEPPTPLLDTVNFPIHMKNLNKLQLNQLADELRSETIFSVSKTGGHLGSSLGVVELTVALHHVFNAPEDRILWDVGHQASVVFCHFEQKYACVCVTRCKTVFSLQFVFGLVMNCVSFCLCTDLSTQDPHRQKVQNAYSSADCWPFRFHKAFRE